MRNAKWPDQCRPRAGSSQPYHLKRQAQPVRDHLARRQRQTRGWRMEDSGTLQALTWLSRAGKVDVRRVLVLRSGSDHDMPPPGRTAADQLV